MLIDTYLRIRVVETAFSGFEIMHCNTVIQNTRTGKIITSLHVHITLISIIFSNDNPRRIRKNVDLLQNRMDRSVTQLVAHDPRPIANMANGANYHVRDMRETCQRHMPTLIAMLCTATKH